VNNKKCPSGICFQKTAAVENTNKQMSAAGDDRRGT
jgi:hypothetical protein